LKRLLWRGIQRSLLLIQEEFKKEGFFFGTPCVIPREETEWIELVNVGFNHLVEINAENSSSTKVRN